MQIILFDGPDRDLLNPFAATQPLGLIRTGLYTNVERWSHFSGLPVHTLSVDYLNHREQPHENDVIFVDACIIPQAREVVDQFLHLEAGEALVKGGRLLGGKLRLQQPVSSIPVIGEFAKLKEFQTSLLQIRYPWNIFQLNDSIIRSDFSLLRRRSGNLPAEWGNTVIAPEQVFVEEGAGIQHCIINASTGPVYIGRNACVMEGSILRGPLAIGESAVVKMGARIYGATTVGPHCTVGGEVKNSVLMGYSNKAHEGYLGDAVIGQWCNLGAGTSNSNIKNDAGEVSVQLDAKTYRLVGQKCGLLLGDYTRCAINTSFNTGTFAGVAGNIFGAGLTPKFLANFTWGYAERYRLDKCLAHINNWKKLKQLELTQTEINILTHLYKKN